MRLPLAGVASVVVVCLAALAAPRQDEPARGDAAATAAVPDRREARRRAVDRAVAKGLAHLARAQTRGGGWRGDSGHKQMDGYVLMDTAERQRRDGEAHLGVSALAGLAFLADGQVPGRGAHAAVVERCLEYVLACSGESGYLAQGESRMYEHAFATLFLAQTRGMSPERAGEIDAVLREAVRFVERTQNGHGGWRYVPFTVECDLSVTVCQVQALRAARNAGVHVSAACIDRVLDYVRASRIPAGPEAGCFYYKIHGRAARTKTSYAINAAAVTALHSAGVYDPVQYGPALTYLEEAYPHLAARWGEHYFFWYGTYYAAQALHMEGGRRWTRFRDRLEADLLAAQREDGSWANSVGPGDAFATAVACLLLRIDDAYLPIFQR